MFLEGDGVLALCPEWQRLQPANGTLLDGVARLPKQLLGEPRPPPTVLPLPVSCACAREGCSTRGCTFRHIIKSGFDLALPCLASKLLS